MTALEAIRTAKSLIEGRMAMSQKTAEVHPDLLTREIAKARVESFRLAILDIEAVRDLAGLQGLAKEPA